MSYAPVPRAATERAGTPAAEEAIAALLKDLADRKEFAALRPRTATTAAPDVAGFVPRTAASAPLFLPGHRLHGAQLFVSNFENPNTEYSRLLVEWQTGTGKSLAAIAIAHEYIRQWRRRAALGDRAPAVFVISFTARETIQRDMLRYPEFGFASASEVEELRRLEAADAAAGPGEPRQLASFLGVLRRRITDRSRGAYYQFYGYKEFANRLLAVTPRGEENRVSVIDLYDRAEGDFGAKLAAAVKRGEVTVNTELLEEMRGGFLIADEIHNVYNISEPNNYGVAIQYALDALGDEAPRAVFMSATPETGSAAEVVDLLNLLVPRSALPDGVPLRRSDFFTRFARAAVPATAAAATADEAEAPRDEPNSQLREGALDRIGHLFAGRVSFLLDSDVGSYPRRIFVGDSEGLVPYLRLTACPMSPFHERTLDAALAARDAATAAAASSRDSAASPSQRGLPPDAGALYDMAYPNPEFATAEAPGAVGLFRSGETVPGLARASEEWRLENGVILDSEDGTTLISGPFLELGRLAVFSTKLDRLVRDVLDIIRAGPGKIMIYHPRVRMSGVLQIQEALRMNGIADEASSPTDATLCAVCGVPRREHPGAAAAAAPATESAATASHDFAPARFVVAHSNVERSTMIRSINRFNASANLNGDSYRIILGSKIVREGYNFRAVRHLLVASFPTDYPTLIQVFGRVARKNSHIELPPDQRDVRIRVYVSTRAGGSSSSLSPELQRYRDKGAEFLVIQEVARARHRYAVDGFANYLRVRAAMGDADRPTLDALPYSPLVGPDEVPDRPRTSTFEAYGYGEREVALLMAVVRGLFQARPVWTYEDLWAAVRGGRGVAGRAGVDPAMFDEGNFAAALAALARPAGEPPAAIVRARRFYVAAAVAPDGAPALDVESYVREPAAPARVTVRLAGYLREARSGENFAVRLREFTERFLRPGAAAPLEFALVEYGAAFHYALLRRLIAGEGPVTSDDARLRKLYRRFRITVAAVAAASSSSSSGAEPEAAGYVMPDAVVLYDRATATWRNAPLADYKIGRRNAENDTVVGFVTSVSPSGDTDDTFAAASALAKFKLRRPLQKLRVGQKTDARLLARGAVCETHPREELRAYVKRLSAVMARAGLDAAAAAAHHDRDRDRDPSAGDLCDAIRTCLLALEERARAPADGMTEGTRYLYLFNERPPTVSALRS